MTTAKTARLVLNVDDNEVGRYTKSRILRHAGYEVLEGETGSAALEIASQRKPDLILLDVKLPDIDGLEVCKLIKKCHPDILVLQISASRVTEGDRVRGLEGGADAYLTQPLAPNELIANVKALLRIRDAEAALRASEAHLQGVLASATDYAIIRLDEKGVVSGWNSGAEQILRWTGEEALGRPIDFIFTEKDQQEGIPKQEQETSRKTGKADDQRWMMRKGGQKFYAVGVMTRLLPPATPGFLKIFRDQTAQFRAETALQELNATLEERVAKRTRDLEVSMRERERAEEQLRQSQKMDALGQLTGGIAHDFNNMLAVVISGLGLIERKLARGETDVKQYTQGVIESARRAADLTQRLLAFSRQQPLSPEPLVANDLVSKLVVLLERTLEERINIETVLAPGLWRASVDPSQLESALLNLAVNARDAMPNGGKLTFETSNADIDDRYAAAHDIESGQYVMIEVSDTGTGMSSEIIGKAFDPFFTTKGVGKGTGLGLSQVFGFVRQSGGHVSIYSEPKIGTTVKVYLPRHYGSDVPRQRLQATSTEGGTASEVVLVVEDEDRVRLMVVDALRELGYTVHAASGGAEALAIIRSGQPVTLLLTDIVMPEMTGPELAEKAGDLLPRLKVLFTTGYSRNAVVNNGVLGPGSHYLPKPFNLDQLAMKVRGVLDA